MQISFFLHLAKPILFKQCTCKLEKYSSIKLMHLCLKINEYLRIFIYHWYILIISPFFFAGSNIFQQLKSKDRECSSSVKSAFYLLSLFSLDWHQSCSAQLARWPIQLFDVYMPWFLHFLLFLFILFT